MPTVIPLRERPELCAFFAKQFETEWPNWYGFGGQGDAAADLSAFANGEGALPVAVVALDDAGLPVGIAALKATSIDTYAHVGPWATAGYVIPQMRRGGIGASLLSALLVEARRLGFNTIYCATATAVSLLEREDWSQIDSIEHEGYTQSIFRREVPGAI
jgi:GNAT superfamily N-acetyltransferase